MSETTATAERIAEMRACDNLCAYLSTDQDVPCRYDAKRPKASQWCEWCQISYLLLALDAAQAERDERGPRHTETWRQSWDRILADKRAAQERAIAAEAARDAAVAEVEWLRARASTLEDAAFHFQTCVTCAEDGEDSCVSGRQFAAFLRGEEMNNGN